MTPENLGCQILADARAISRLPNFTRMALEMRLKMRSIYIAHINREKNDYIRLK